MVPAVLLTLWMVLSPTLIGGRCSACIWLGVRSTVTEGLCSSTLLYIPGHFDEDGKYHAPPSQTTCVHRCSRGHTVVSR